MVKDKGRHVRLSFRIPVIRFFWRMELKIFEQAVLRTPVFEREALLWERGEELVGLIAEAAPEVAGLIRTLGPAAFAGPGSPLGYTVWKYFNRARYRATPFGRFAALGQVTVGAGTIAPLLAAQARVVNFRNWADKESLERELAVAADPGCYRANSTLYPLGGELRYIHFNKELFRLEAVPASPELAGLLDFCVGGVTAVALRTYLQETLKLPLQGARLYLRELVGCGLLVTDLQANITGPDFFERSGAGKPKSGKKYTIACRTVEAGGLEASALAEVAEFADFMQRHTTGEANPRLEAFKTAFVRNFDRQWKPLGEVLDPDAGIGYGPWGVAADDAEMDWGTDPGPDDNAGPVVALTPLNRFLLQELVRNQKEIDLQVFQCEPLKAPLPTANTLSLLFNWYGERVVVNQLGGCTATALLGRFTLADAGINQLAERLAGIEMAANPEVDFFEVAYQGEPEIDNVNRRGRFYPVELPINSWSLAEEVLALKEIYITVRAGQVVLWSERLGRRIIPRLSTAYNYQRSNLPLYRFLCDLQFQGIRANLGLDIRSVFPALDDYPRVVYKNLIISPAAWRLPAQLYTGQAGPESRALLQRWLAEKGIVERFRVGRADQTLCLDPADGDDLAALVLYARKSAGEVWLTEALTGSRNDPADARGRAYAGQYQVALTHNGEIYAGVAPGPGELGIDFEDRTFPPLQDWLYLELYGHPLRADELLSRRLKGLLNSLSVVIRGWFFVRYADPAPHIRLRIHLRDSASGARVCGQVLSTLAGDYRQGLLRDIQVKTYQREVERYGIRRIASLERLFCLDSRGTLVALKASDTHTRRYARALPVLNGLLGAFSPNPAQQLAFAGEMAAVFAREFGYKAADFKRINQNFRSLGPEAQGAVPPGSVTGAFIRLAGKVLSEVAEARERQVLLADIIHMHINRQFPQRQRFHEAVLYQYLRLLLNRKRHYPDAPAQP